MLQWAASFFVIAICAAFLGAGNVEYMATKAAIVLFVVALVMLVLGVIPRNGPPAPPAV